MTIIATGSVLGSETFVHRTGATLAGGPASRYHRVARCGDRVSGRRPARPNYAARRLGVLFAALSVLMFGSWIVGEVAADVSGHPVSAAESSIEVDEVAGGNDSIAPRVHVARDGDTLWSIADTHRGAVSRDRFIDALVGLNGGTSIDIGQAIFLP